MALSATDNGPLSPSSAGRTSPIPRALAKRPPEDAVKHDKNFRKYATNIERALALFESTQQEWADYISFLSRLLKALQTGPASNHVIPQATLIATRLAQCLNPSLPSGVHQKALEVYTHIFETLGKDALASDLQTYLAGLSSVLSFASLSVRPAFLSLLQNHVLPLDSPSIRPALKAVILSLLPGLEDESSEDFDRILRLLGSFRRTASDKDSLEPGPRVRSWDSYFWQCLFLATITNPSRRQGALAFLARAMPRLIVSDGVVELTNRAPAVTDLPPESQSLVSPEPGLLIRCFIAGLSDSQLLIQRGFLDLLVTHLPLNSPVLQAAVSTQDFEKLVMAAATVVQRRDMSLNRRLWAWFLGPEPKHVPESHQDEIAGSPLAERPNSNVTYFAQFGAKPLSTGIKRLLAQGATSSSSKARPFRICLSLMDRWEVGGSLVPEIFIPAMQSAYEYSLIASKAETDEVVRSASIFFDGVESGLIWSQLMSLGGKAMTQPNLAILERLEVLKLQNFIISRFNVREEDMVMHHVPYALASSLANALPGPFASKWTKDENNQLQAMTLTNCEILAGLLPKRTFAGIATLKHAEIIQVSKQGLSIGDVAARIRAQYQEQTHDAASVMDVSHAAEIGAMLVRLMTEHITLALERRKNLETSVKLFNDLLQKIPNSIYLCQPSKLLATVLRHVTTSSKSSLVPFPVLSTATTIVAGLHFGQLADNILDSSEVCKLVTTLVHAIWNYLSPIYPKYHVEAARSIWTLEAVSSPRRDIESAIAEMLRDQISSDAGRRFATLWTHTVQDSSPTAEKSRSTVLRRVSGIPGISGSRAHLLEPESMLTRPLLSLLDTLSPGDSELSAFTRTWLKDLPSLRRIFVILTSNAKALQCLQSTEAITSSNKESGPASLAVDDSSECLYYMQHIQNLLELASDHTWMCIAGEMAPGFEAKPDGGYLDIPIQNLLVEICTRALNVRRGHDLHGENEMLQRSALMSLQAIFKSPFAAPLKELELELPLLDRLQRSLKETGPLLQIALLDTILAALRLQSHSSLPPTVSPPESPTYNRRLSKQLNGRTSSSSQDDAHLRLVKVPPQLITCLRAGFSSSSSRLVLDKWVDFFTEVLPLFTETMFQSLLPLVEIFCSQISQLFNLLKLTFEGSTDISAPESSLISLMNGLEQTLAQAHKRLMQELARGTPIKSPEQPQGFFGNMVSGVFASEAQPVSRSASANNRLTVLLCFQDALKICFSLWSWGSRGSEPQQDVASIASYGYSSLRVRNRARRLLEHLFAAEGLESLETLCALWYRPPSAQYDTSSVMNLLNVLNGSKPKNTIPAIFNSLYSRTNPSAIEPHQSSTLTQDLADTEIVLFLLEYTRSLEDDTMDEIWTDCVTFLRDILSNPMPHRQILPALLEFIVVLAEKLENTNFGEERKMRRELADLFMRLLTATFTSRPVGFLQDSNHGSTTAKTTTESSFSSGDRARMSDVVGMLVRVAPKLQLVLADSDKLATVAATTSANVISPAVHAKNFPLSMSPDIMALLLQLCTTSQASRSWRKDVSDAFNDARFFSMPSKHVKEYWVPVLNQLNISDKEKLPELLLRITAPATAGLMFGVGASSARQDSDRKTQLNLRRIAVLVLSCPEDTFVSNIAITVEKVAELLTATPVSSPSSVTRAEVFMLIRALVLKVSAVHLAPLWPVLNVELGIALASALPDSDAPERYDAASLLQACKLLDVLVTVAPDEFQLYEWLFVTDTSDAVYKPADWEPAALADEIAEGLGSATAGPEEPSASFGGHSSSSMESDMRGPLLELMLTASGVNVHDLQRDDLVRRVLRPFFGQLSILAFEATYSMQAPDLESCKDFLLKDLFNDVTG